MELFKKRVIDKSFFAVFTAWAGIWLLLYTHPVQGQSLPRTEQVRSGNHYFYSILVPVMETHDRIKSAEEAVKNAREKIRISLGKWYPELMLNMETGREDQYDKEYPDQYNRMNMVLKQQIADFGKTSADVEQARKTAVDKELNMAKVRRRFIVDAATAYQNLHRAYKTLAFSRESEANIRRQTGLEQIRVDEGSGYTTDVLQSKSQLASAVARRLQNEGKYNQAKSQYLEFFDTLPGNIETTSPIDISGCSFLPADLEQAVQDALKNNLGLMRARNRETMAEISLKKEKTKAFYPDIDMTLDGSLSENYNGVSGNTNEYKVMVTLKKNFNLGLTEKNKIKAARHNFLEAQYQLADMKKRIRKETAMAWERLKTARSVTVSLIRQAELTKAFLNLARKERQLGNRSLTDILAGETSLINARSDSYSAKIDISLAMFSLLNTMGELNAEIFNTTPSPYLNKRALQ